MGRLSVFIWFFVCGIPLLAQTTISGQFDLESISVLDARVYLSQIKLEDFPDLSGEATVASTSFDENGHFSFEALQIAKKDAIYRIYVNQFEGALNKVVQADRLFILSRNDRIRFKKSGKPFEVYNNTNDADVEWQRLRKYESALRGFELRTEDSLALAYMGKVKDYAKDSLQILMVKLIGIKQLDQKQLLEKDIVQNPDYYLSLLNQLRQSDLDRSDYLFLENKLAFLTTDMAEEKFRTSTIVNMVLGFSLVVLLIVLFSIRNKRRPLPFATLSNQEQTIQQLILEGKSNKEIAKELFISLSTVKTHITHIYNKLQVSNRRELLQKTRN